MSTLPADALPLVRCFPLAYEADPSRRFDLIRHAQGAILLDAGQPKAYRGRFDLMSAWPIETLEPKPQERGSAFFQRLRQALERLGPTAVAEQDQPLPFAGGLMGMLSYDFGQRLEHLPQQAMDDIGLPDARLGLYGWALISDHQQQRSYLMFHPAFSRGEQACIQALFVQDEPTAACGSFKLSTAFTPELSPETYQQAIARIQDYIQAGDCYQVNFTQRFRATYQGDPWLAYQALRRACPTPFAAYMAWEDTAIASLSPERFLKVSQGQVEARPIKGTRPRRAAIEHDQAEIQQLKDSLKDRAENLMIVDLLRNDLGRSCQIGSIRVPELFAIESYPNVHHLVSSVTGALAEGKDALDLLAGSFPGGSITGAPKIRAMQIIDELEPCRRQLYCGSLLYVDVRGEMDSSIAIRSLIFKQGQVHCWGGGGIVMDSEAEAEYQESLTKVRVLMQTLEQL